MNKEKLMSYLREKVRNMKNFSGDKLYVRLKRLERVIKAERINGRICNEELEELMMAGYIAAQKRVADEIMDKCFKNLDDQCYVDENGEKILRPDSELGKAFGELAEGIKIIYSDLEED